MAKSKLDNTWKSFWLRKAAMRVNSGVSDRRKHRHICASRAILILVVVYAWLPMEFKNFDAVASPSFLSVCIWIPALLSSFQSLSAEESIYCTEYDRRTNVASPIRCAESDLYVLKNFNIWADFIHIPWDNFKFWYIRNVFLFAFILKFR